MKPSLLLTGATGRLGQLVAANLNSQKIAWQAFARRPEAAKALGASEVHAGDFDNPGALASAMQGIKTVIMISGDSPNQDVLELGVLQAAKNAGVEHIVKLSAQSAGLNPPVSFGRKHAKVESAVIESGVNWTFIRPVFFQQSFLMFADSIQKNSKIILPARNGECAFVDARDVAACLVKTATESGHEGKVYTLTGPRAIRFSEAAQIIGALRRKDVGYLSPPAWLARMVLPKAAGMPKWLASEVIDLLQAIANNDQAKLTGDIEKLLSSPPRNFESFAKENIAAFS